MDKYHFIKKYDLKELFTSDGFCIDLIYTTSNNFTNQKLYDSSDCLLRATTAQKLLLANKKFNKLGFKIKIWDAFRPVKIQEKMWEIYPDENFVANPAKGKSNHCKGSAVDVTLCTMDNVELKMPTEFDHFGIESYRNYYSNLPDEVQKNVIILEKTMIECGFEPNPTEWWHFNDTDNYEIIYENYEID